MHCKLAVGCGVTKLTGNSVRIGIPDDSSSSNQNGRADGSSVRIDEWLLNVTWQQSEQLQGFRTEMGEWQMTLKQELCEDILQELTASLGVSALLSVATDGVVTKDDTGTSTEEVTHGSGGGESYSTVAARGGGAVTAPTSQQQRPAQFDGKVIWEAYQTQFELLVKIKGGATLRKQPTWSLT